MLELTHPFRSKYSPPKRVSISFLDENGEYQPGKTEQCHKDLCDITKIIKTYDKTGLITHVNKSAAQYGDFTEINEYKENLEMIIKAKDNFAELPSHIRKKFGNDPGAFFEFVTNPANKDEMVKLGLAIAATPEAPIIVKMEETPEKEETLEPEK